MITEDEIQDLIQRMEGNRRHRPSIKRVSFPPLAAQGKTGRMKIALDYLADVPVTLTVELGSTTMKVKEILRLVEGSVIELDRPAGDTADVLLNEQPFARGEVVVLGGNFGVRIESICEISKTRLGGEKQ